MQTTSTTEGKTAAAKSHAWTIDTSHSSAAFSVRHLMITNVRGEFEKFTGTVSYDPARPEATTVTASIDVASISTRDEKRDEHLRSADFFEAAKYPTLSVTSKALRQGDKGLELVGDLTIKETTREVVLLVDGPTPPQVDPWGNERIGASAHTKIKRSEFGITWNTLLETGGALVGDEITITLDVSLIRQK